MKEEEFKGKEQEASKLDICLVDAISKGMFWESKANLADQRLDAVLDLVKDANRRAKEVDAWPMLWMRR